MSRVGKYVSKYANRAVAKNIARLGDALSSKINLLTEPQRNYMFEFSSFETSDSGLFAPQMKTYVKTIETPSFARDVKVLDYMDTKIMYAGKDSSPHTFSVTFWEDESMSVHDYLHRWYQLSGDHKYNESANKADYIKNVNISYRDVTDLVSTGVIKIYNVFPIEISAVSMSYEDSSVMEMQATFAFDYIEFDDFVANLSDAIETIKTKGGEIF